MTINNATFAEYADSFTYDDENLTHPHAWLTDDEGEYNGLLTDDHEDMHPTDCPWESLYAEDCGCPSDPQHPGCQYCL